MSSSGSLARSRAAAKYRPERTRLLFVAESPPLSEDRYFYFETVNRSDWLWIALMKALFGLEFGDTRSERERKPYWLKRFQKCGFFLVDAVKTPLSGSNKERMALINAGAPTLLEEIRKIAPDRIALVKATVHRALFKQFQKAGFPVVNRRVLPFPAFGQQTRFQSEFRCLVDSGQLSV